MKRFLFSCLLSLVIIFGVHAEEFKCEVFDKSSVSTTGDLPTGISVSYSQTYVTKCQMTADNSVTYTISGLDGYIITGIKLSMKSNKSAGAGSLSATVGNTVIASIDVAPFSSDVWNGAYTTSYVDKVLTLEDDNYEVKTNEVFNLIIKATQNSLYCQSLTITYKKAGAIDVSLPIFSVEKESFSTPFDLELSNVDNNTILYTLDGSDPKEFGVEYVSPISISINTLVRAVAKDKAGNYSSVLEKNYVKLTSYSLVTNINDLKYGDKIVIVAADENCAMSTTQESDYRKQTEIEKKDNIVLFGNDTEIFTLESGLSANSYAFNANTGGYIYCASTSSKNYLRTEDEITAKSSWTIEIGTDGIAVIKSMVDEGTTTRNWLRYNKQNPRFACYASGQDDIKIYKKESASISVSVPDDLGYVTFCHSENVIIPDGVKAYAATAANDSYVSLEEITGVIPAGEGCLLAAAKGDYTLFVGGDASSVATNYMVGNPTAERVAVNYNDNNSYYVLVEQDGFLVFGKKVSDFSVAAGKAYLCIPGMSSSASLRIGFPGTTGIYNVNVESDEAAVVYDLAGRRVNNVVEPGIYIVNGKKVFINK